MRFQISMNGHSAWLVQMRTRSLNHPVTPQGSAPAQSITVNEQGANEIAAGNELRLDWRLAL